MKFTFAQIEAFAAVAEAGTFHAAARRLNLTQPAVSQRIHELEEAIQLPLFIRGGGRIRLTNEGVALVDYSRRLLQAANELPGHLRSRDPLHGVLRLGVPTSFARACVTELLRRLDEQHPALKIDVRVNDSGTLTQMLDDQDLDVALLVEPVAIKHVSQQSVGSCKLAWFASKDLALPRIVRPADLAELHVVSTPQPSRLLATVLDWFATAGITPRRLSTCNSLTLAVQTISSGLTIGVLPPQMMQDEVKHGRVRQLKASPTLPPHIVAICHQTDSLGPGLDAVVAMMRSLIVEYRVFE